MAICLFCLGFGHSAHGQSLSVLPKTPPLAKVFASADEANASEIVVSSTQILAFGDDTPLGAPYGKLIWLGGLELDSNAEGFGGFSSIAFVGRREFISVADNGAVLSGKLELDGERPTAMHEASLTPLPGFKDFRKRSSTDAEGLALVGNEAFVSFEGRARLTRYFVSNGRFRKGLGDVKLPASVSNAAKGNSGLEAVAYQSGGGQYSGALVLISEAARGGRVPGWIYQNGTFGAFSLPQSGKLLVTDADFTANGDLVFVERDFSLLGGLTIQLRRVRNQDLKTGEIQTAELLMRANLDKQIDNMEGIAVQPAAGGGSIITLISDDNLSRFQRTLLLRFKLDD